MTGIGSAGKAVQRVVRTVDSNIRAARLSPLERRGGRRAQPHRLRAAGHELRIDFGQFELRVRLDGVRQGAGGDRERLDLLGDNYADRGRRPARHAQLVDRLRLLPHQRHRDQLSTACPPRVRSIYRSNNSFATTNFLLDRRRADWANSMPSGSTVIDASVSRVTSFNGHAACLNISRSDKRAGALQYVDRAPT